MIVRISAARLDAGCSVAFKQKLFKLTCMDEVFQIDVDDALLRLPE